MIEPRTLLALRLAAQRLSPATRAVDVAGAARTTCGVQAQDLRACALALRSRVEGLTGEQIAAAPVVRTWTARGTAHLIAADDRDWMHAALTVRHRPDVERKLVQRGEAEAVHALAGDVDDLLAHAPLDRPQLLAALAERGHPPLSQPTTNVLMPWLVAQGRVVGDAQGRWRAASAPDPVDDDEALATLARRYLAGYGPATDRDLAAWSGLPLGTARRATEAGGPFESHGGLLAAPGALDDDPPPPLRAALLGGFDPVMLGYASREPVVAEADDRRILPGGGMLRAAVLARGRAVGTWRLRGGGRRRTVELDWFGRRPARAALADEAADVGRLLDLDLTLA